MKKILSIVLVLVTMFSITVTANAAASDDYGIMPCYNNTTTAFGSLSIDSNGKATATAVCNGKDSVTTKIVVTTKLERKFGIIWLDVSDGEWTDTVNGEYLSKVHSIQLSKTGTYRATFTFTVYGSGGSADEIEIVKTATY